MSLIKSGKICDALPRSFNSNVLLIIKSKRYLKRRRCGDFEAAGPSKIYFALRYPENRKQSLKKCQLNLILQLTKC